MDFTLWRYGLGFAAGLLSTLSPCVLPLLPVLIASALAAHPRAPLALAAGLALSYAAAGTLLASAAGALPFSATMARDVAAGFLGLFGLALLSNGLARAFYRAGAGLADLGQRLGQRWRLEGMSGQFVVGVLLGLIWSPCVGPTLGAAIVLAGQGRQLPQVALLMGLFGLGAALPVLLLAGLSRHWLRPRLATLGMAGAVSRGVLGLVLLLVALLIVSGLDRVLETWLVEHSPDWLTALTTRF
ncbi:MAG: cytochrome c biogenesis protein CcdA [Paludibacterium sp.]|uniref:cytochrome c biogenesis CcdA family protein n=1 Tax=Paludibacterium sp. TaxID=1917523 RepID=UPI0025E59EFC|nr:cytochrome c biogenesis protein CcdA [Paludibacterium sp.]MBV8048219.1 cytochrome c biogenesis protein CcdA [Paludibacterium sp.]MBV8645899.1 cytochrome c biogenesis protein CcdA [Paludibacterium sp.]